MLLDFIYLLKDDAIFAASNTENEGEDSTTHAISAIDGLVAGHAYSMLECREVHVGETVHEIIRIRNPWAKTEWTGSWNDEDPIWDKIRPEEKARYHSNEADGAFWMAFDDFLRYISLNNIIVIIIIPDIMIYTGIINLCILGNSKHLIFAICPTKKWVKIIVSLVTSCQGSMHPKMSKNYQKLI